MQVKFCNNLGGTVLLRKGCFFFGKGIKKSMKRFLLNVARVLSSQYVFRLALVESRSWVRERKVVYKKSTGVDLTGQTLINPVVIWGTYYFSVRHYHLFTPRVGEYCLRKDPSLSSLGHRQSSFTSLTSTEEICVRKGFIGACTSVSPPHLQRWPHLKTETTRPEEVCFYEPPLS